MNAPPIKVKRKKSYGAALQLVPEPAQPEMIKCWRCARMIEKKAFFKLCEYECPNCGYQKLIAAVRHQPNYNYRSNSKTTFNARAEYLRRNKLKRDGEL